jgi:hypothetical protein
LSNVGFEHELLRAENYIGWDQQCASIGKIEYLAPDAAMALLEYNTGSLQHSATRRASIFAVRSSGVRDFHVSAPIWHLHFIFAAWLRNGVDIRSGV